MLSARERWFADILQAGLETRVLVEPEVLVHVTPAVLSKSMPRDVLVRMFDSALSAGMLSPEAVLQTITPELLAGHVQGSLLWECICAAVERVDIAKGTDDKMAREFLRRALDSGLRTHVLAPAHVVQHVDARVLVHYLPDELMAQLMESGLAAGRMSPELVIDVLGVEPIATYVPTNIVWECLAEIGEGLLLKDDAPRATATPAAPSSAISAALAKVDVVDAVDLAKSSPKRIVMDYMDDDMVSMSVEDDGNHASGLPADTSVTAGYPPVAES